MAVGRPKTPNNCSDATTRPYVTPPTAFCKSCLKGHRLAMDCPETLRGRRRRARKSGKADSPLKQSHLPIDQDISPNPASVAISELRVGHDSDELAWTKHEWQLDQARLLAVTSLDSNYCMGKNGELLIPTFEQDDSTEQDPVDNFLGLSHPDDWVREHARMRYDFAAARTRQIDVLEEVVAEKDRLLVAQEKELEELRFKIRAMRGILQG